MFEKWLVIIFQEKIRFQVLYGFITQFKSLERSGDDHYIIYNAQEDKFCWSL